MATFIAAALSRLLKENEQLVEATERLRAAYRNARNALPVATEQGYGNGLWSHREFSWRIEFNDERALNAFITALDDVLNAVET